MKMKKTKVCIELDLPFTVEPLKIADLRKVYRDIRTAQGCDVALPFMLRSQGECNVVSGLLGGFVYAHQFGDKSKRGPRTFGACENFMFERTYDEHVSAAHPAVPPAGTWRVYERRCQDRRT